MEGVKRDGFLFTGPYSHVNSNLDLLSRVSIRGSNLHQSSFDFHMELFYWPVLLHRVGSADSSFPFNFMLEYYDS